MTVLGIDGCRGGWVIAQWDDDPVRLSVRVSSTQDLREAANDAEVVGIDIPIGLLDQGERACDQEARRFLGRSRASSVFTAPIRPVLKARTHADGSAITRRVNGKGLSIQAFNIVSKVKAIDDLLRAEPALRARVREVHPEVSFALMNGVVVAASKKTAEGRALRRRLLSREFGAALVARACDARPAGCADDDLLDAIAVAWSARRLKNGDAVELPVNVVADRYGLRMQIAG